LKDADFRVRAHAAAALGTLGEDAKDAAPELLHALQDKHMSVQLHVANTLVGLAALGVPGMFEKIKEADRKGRWATPFILDKFGPQGQEAVAALIKDLRDKDAKVRAQAATGLAALGVRAKAAVNALNKAFEDEDDVVRMSAALALTQIDTARGRDKLLRQRLLGEPPGPHEKGLTWRLLPPEVVHKAMTDRNVQTRYLRFFKYYVFVVLTTDHRPGEDLAQWRANVDRQLETLGPEAVPALVSEINLIVWWRLGFC
jgi:hypothetical protein